MTISGRAHPVQNYFLEDVVAATGYVAAACGGNDRELGRRNEGTESVGLCANQIKVMRTSLLREPSIGTRPRRRRTAGTSTNWTTTVIAAIEAVVEGCFPSATNEVAESWEDTEEEVDDGAVLVFLPGVGEIRRLADSVMGVFKVESLFMCGTTCERSPREISGRPSPQYLMGMLAKLS